ncbi:MAG: AI-2E family transporter [Bacteroidota bacterium]
MRIRTVENASFLALVVLVTLAFLGLLRTFLEPVFWAVVLAILFNPVYEALRDQLGGRRTLASVLTIGAVVLLVILPLTGIGIAVTGEAVTVYDRVASGEIDVTAPVEAFERWLPLASEQMQRFNVDFDRVRESLENTAVTVSQFVASQAIALGQGAVNVLILFVLTLYLLFFFLRDGDRLIEGLIRALPLGDPRERKLFARFAQVSRATVKGTLVVGIVQGTLGGLLFWVLGLGAPVLWGVVMTILSMLPAVGSALVWGPAAVYLIATGSVAKGIILIAVGALLIGLVDNVLRPLLVGRDTQLPDYVILFSTLGGIVAFGLSGFVIGPIIAGLFITVWEMFIEEFSDLDDTVATAEDATLEPVREAGDGQTAEPVPVRPEVPAEQSETGRS